MKVEWILGRRQMELRVPFDLYQFLLHPLLSAEPDMNATTNSP